MGSRWGTMVEVIGFEIGTESIQSIGFWQTIMSDFPRPGQVEMGYGHSPYTIRTPARRQTPCLQNHPSTHKIYPFNHPQQRLPRKLILREVEDTTRWTRNEKAKKALTARSLKTACPTMILSLTNSFTFAVTSAGSGAICQRATWTTQVLVRAGEL